MARLPAGVTTVAQYVASLSEEQRATVKQIRAFVRKHIPRGYEEALNWGVISWQVPLKILPNTYNGFPLTYVGLSARKTGYSLYLMGEYGTSAHENLRKAFAREGKKLSMGKCCVTFKRIDQLALDPLAESIARIPMKTYIAMYDKVRKARA